MKLKKRLRGIVAYANLFIFQIRKFVFGFEYANNFVKNLDKDSLLLVLTSNGAKIGRDCDIESGMIIHNCLDYSNLLIGDNCHVGKNCFFDLQEKVLIKDNVVISMKSSFITHIDMSKSSLSRQYPVNSKGIIINESCYLGLNSQILMGVEIGSNSIVSAGSLVLKSVSPFSLVGGVPAKHLKMIF